MEEPKRASVIVTCKCGQEIELPIVTIEAPFTCAGCGETHRLDAGRIAKITAAFGEALMDAAGQIENGARRAQVEVSVPRKEEG